MAATLTESRKHGWTEHKEHRGTEHNGCETHNPQTRRKYSDAELKETRETAMTVCGDRDWKREARADMRGQKLEKLETEKNSLRELNKNNHK